MCGCIRDSKIYIGFYFSGVSKTETQSDAESPKEPQIWFLSVDEEPRGQA